MLKEVKYKLVSVSPLILHNVRHFIDPFDPWQREFKRLTSKKKKSDDDLLAIRAQEWKMGLYLDEKGHPCVPGECIEAMLAKSAAKQRKGQAFKAGVMSDGNWVIQHEGPKDLEKLYADARFVDCRAMVVQRNRVMRTRPIFRNWKLAVTIQYNPAELNEQDITEAMKVAGELVGLCDGRPRYGRFLVEVA